MPRPFGEMRTMPSPHNKFKLLGERDPCQWGASVTKEATLRYASTPLIDESLAANQPKFYGDLLYRLPVMSPDVPAVASFRKLLQS